MDLWIYLSLAAATAQTARFMLQKQLKTVGLSNGGATFARFVYSAPLVGAVLWLYAGESGQSFPSLSLRFWLFLGAGAMSQILATVCVVAIFSHRNFAVGITFKKSEVILTAVAGFLVLGETINRLGAAAMALGLVGVIVLSDPPDREGQGVARFFNVAAGLGLLSGVFFAISAVGYGGAVRALESGDLVLRAGVTLAWGTAVQTLVLGLWLMLSERGEIGRVLRYWRISGAVGLCSMIGSFCWFAAFALQNVAYVFAVGQVELILSIAASVLVFREVVTRRELVGISILAAGILTLVLAPEL